MACYSEDLKCWEAWDKAKDTTPLIAWSREALKEEALDDLHWEDERGPSSTRRTLEPFQRQCWGNFWEMWWSAYGLFRAHRYHLELNWRREEKEITWLSLHCHHHNDSCIEMGGHESRFNVSLTVRDKVTRQCPQTTTFLRRRESRSGIEPRPFCLQA